MAACARWGVAIATGAGYATLISSQETSSFSPRDLPRHGAAVHATLDAINRQIALHLPSDQEP